MEIVAAISAMLGVAWASGINLYAAVLTLGVLGNMGSVDLPPGLELVEDPLVIAAAGLMFCVEFFADKIPGVDSLWDALHSFIRIPAGAVLASGAASGISPEAEFAGLLIGGALAAGTHFTKAGSRVLVNTSPEPFSNIAVSLGEDVIVVAGLWTALNQPITFIALLVLSIALAIWLLPKIWRGIKRVFSKIRSWFGGPSIDMKTPPTDDDAVRKQLG